ncbi:hypothetical protein B0H67DRAFT_554505 [Lasiosphaeris hirsuta]|uniref:Uncharacterized protein n=1 Tax=Lasiosphaeris hirsuta TaxID=260670 RepID=A0AA40AHU2_9PEZI|nr:hypothetical protein B0H67DRAFT_554505 [Lasiosphaeris hirsuta]
MPFFNAHSIRESLVMDPSVTIPQSNHHASLTVAEQRPLEVDFQGCESVVFWDGPSRTGDKYLLHTKGTGRVSLPAGVQMHVTNGKVLLRQAPARQSAGASTVGAGYGSYRDGSASPSYSPNSPSRVADDFVVQEEHPDAQKWFSQMEVRR